MHRPHCACTHGAPPVSSAPGAALFSAQLVRALAGDATADGQLLVLVTACRGDANAKTPATAEILRATALDAALSNDADGARTALRAAAFVDAYATAGDAFLAAICGTADGTDAGSSSGASAAEAFGGALMDIATRDGFLRTWASCKCKCAAKLLAATTAAETNEP